MNKTKIEDIVNIIESRVRKISSELNLKDPAFKEWHEQITSNIKSLKEELDEGPKNNVETILRHSQLRLYPIEDIIQKYPETLYSIFGKRISSTEYYPDLKDYMYTFVEPTQLSIFQINENFWKLCISPVHTIKYLELYTHKDDLKEIYKTLKVVFQYE